MMKEFLNNSYLFGGNAPFIEDLYEKYLVNPASVPDEWREYLRASFAEGKPLDQLIREILSADGTVPTMRPAAKFYLDRDADANLIARDVGRLFFGRDFQCAQCHDHPYVEEWKQEVQPV